MHPRNNTRPNDYALMRFNSTKFNSYKGIQGIAELVSTEVRIPLKEIKSKRQTRKLSEARQIIMWFGIIHKKGTQAAIGAYLNRDHSTVDYGVKTINNLLDSDKYISNLVRNITHKLG